MEQGEIEQACRLLSAATHVLKEIGSPAAKISAGILESACSSAEQPSEEWLSLARQQKAESLPDWALGA